MADIRRLVPYLFATATLAGAVGIAFLLGGLPGDSAMILLIPILWTAMRYGRWAALFAASLAALGNNYFFIPPAYHFGLDSVADAVTLAVFLTVALAVGGLAARLHDQVVGHRRQAELAELRKRDAQLLYDVARAISAAADVEEMDRRVRQIVRDQLGTEIGHARPDAGNSPAFAQREGKDHSQIIALVAEQVAQAAERLRLRTAIEAARIDAETERLRSTLLSSVTHDFRTPLASIIGSASSLLSAEAVFSEQARAELAETILDSARRLDRYVRNILDISRLQSGAVRPDLGWVDLEDVIGAALAAQGTGLAGSQVMLDLQPGLPPVRADFILIERVIGNLVENAVKFGKEGGTIEVSTAQNESGIRLTVFNEGPEIAETRLATIFEPFTRGDHGQARIEGTGLGLSICHGFMRLHGGKIEARNVRGRGMALDLFFPSADVPSMERIDDE